MTEARNIFVSVTKPTLIRKEKKHIMLSGIDQSGNPIKEEVTITCDKVSILRYLKYKLLGRR
jgi:hypothetical protein